MLNKQYYIYFVTNKSNKVLYVGVTNDLRRRVYEHRNRFVNGFTKKYRLNKLVYYEMCEDVESAILREKQIKAGSRQKKNNLVERVNLAWEDLSERI